MFAFRGLRLIRSVLFTALTVSAIFAVRAPAAQAAVCFQDVRSYEAVRAQLPRMFQYGEFYAVHSSLALKGGFRVFQAGSRFVIEAKGHAVGMGSINEDQNIRQMCFNGPNVTAVLDNGQNDNLMLLGGGIRFRGFVFTQVSPQAYWNFARTL